jgi:hypothetical protein
MTLYRHFRRSRSPQHCRPAARETRIEVIHPAVLIYFDAACTVLEHYEPGALISTLGERLGPEVEQLLAGLPSGHDKFALPGFVARQFREEVGLDFEAVRSALTDHLHERLIDVKAGLAYIEESLTAGDVQPGDAILVMQIDDDDINAIFKPEIMRSRGTGRAELSLCPPALWGGGQPLETVGGARRHGRLGRPSRWASPSLILEL